MFVSNLRQSGIDTIGDVAWGTHFCHFYKTREDLLSILVPYFKAGLANNEFCMWVTAEPVNTKDAAKAMTEAVPDFASCVSRGQMEIVSQDQWYRRNGALGLQKALDGWMEKLNEALGRGYDGMRVSGDTMWVEGKDWKEFADYEATVDSVIGKHRMIALCTYSLARCETNAVFDVMRNHGVAVVRNEGEWEVVETSSHGKSTEALRESEEHLRAVLNASAALIVLLDRDGTVLEANQAQSQLMGLKHEEVLGRNIWDLFRPDIAQRRRAQVGKVLQTGEPLRVEDEGQNGRWYGASLYPVRSVEGDITGVAVYSRDITEAKRADDTVRGSEELYRRLLGSTSDAIFVLDGEWQYVLFNEAYMRIVGLSKETLTGSKITDLFPGIEETEFFKAFERVIEMRVSETVNGEFTFPDGRTGWYDVRVDPVPEGILCIARDVTEQKRVLDSLGASEEKHRLLVENAHEAIAVIRIEDTRMLFANKAAEEMSGYSAEKLMSCSMLEFIHPDDREMMAERHLRRLMGEDVPPQHEFRYIDRWGNTKWVTMNSAVLDWEGKPAVLVFLNDVTERRQADEELRRSEESYRRIVQTANEGICAFGADLRITFANQKMADMLGYSVEELTGKDGRALLMFEEDLPEVESRLASRRRGEPGQYEQRFRRKDGSDCWVVVSAAPVTDAEGRFSGSIAMFTDINDRKKADDEVRRSEERYRRLVEDLPESFIVYSYAADGTVDYVSPGAEKVFGMVVKEGLHSDWMQFLDWDREDLVAGWENIANLLSGREFRRTVELSFTRPDGQRRTILVRPRPKKDGDGAIVGVEGIVEDITERKRAELALAADNERREALLGLQRMMDASEKEIVEHVVESSLKATRSDHAFVGLMDDTESLMTISAWSREAMAQGAMEQMPTEYPVAEGGIWTECVRERRPVIVNDFETPGPGEKGYTEHVRITRFMSVPVFEGERIRAVVAVANGESPYDERSTEGLRTLADRMWGMIRRSRTERALRLENERRGVLLGLQRLMDASEKEIFDYVVEGAVKSTQSEMSFITLMDETESVMTVHGWSREAMEQCSMQDKPMHFPVAEAGIWAECVRQRRPVFVNDYEADNPAKKGYPLGHVAVRRFLSAPVFDGDRIVAVIAVANKMADYDESDANALVVLTYRMWAIVRRKRAEDELRASLERYRSLYESIAGGVVVQDRDGVITEANAMASEILGLTRDEITGRTSADPGWRAVHEDGSDFGGEDHPSMVTMRTGQSTRNVVMGVHNPDRDEQRWILINSEPIRDTASGETQAAVTTFLDITDRRKMIEDLRLSEERYRLVVENTHEAVVVIRDGEIIFANTKAEGLTGYPADELVSRSMLDFIHPGDQQKVADRYVRRMRGEAVPSAYEIRLTDRWGEMRHVELNVAPTQWNDEGPVLIAFLNDVTERKKAEDELQASEERYRLVVENAHEAILVIQDDRIVFANARAEQMSGYTAEDFSSMTVLDYVHPDDSEMMADLYVRRLDGEEAPPAFVFRMVDKRGRTMWVEANSVLFEWQGKPAIGAFVNDVTERKKAEDELKASEERYRLVVENAQEAIVIVQDGRIGFVNNRAQEMTGYTLEELAATSILDYVHPEDRELAGVLYERRVKGEKAPTVFSFRYLDKGGNTRWAEANAAVFDWHGRPAIAAFLNDVTERRKAEDEVRATGERYRLVVENTYDAIAIIQEDRIVFANRKGEELAGYLREDLLSMAMTDFIHPDDRDGVIDIYRKTMIGADVPETIEFRFIDREGRIKLVEVNGVLFEWEDKPALLIFMSDITERRRAVDELRASEERYKLVVENTYDAIVVIQDGMIVFANRKAEELAGYPREDLFQKPMTDFVHPDDARRIIADYEEAMKGQAILSSYEFRFVTKEGNVRLVQVNGALFDWEGKPALLGFISDITERRRAEEELKASEEKYRRIVETASEGIVVTNEEGRVTFANSRAAQLFGYSVAEMMRKSYVDFVPRKDIGRYRAAWKRHKKGASEQYETCLARKDGSTVWTMVSATPLPKDHNQYGGTLAMITDITGLKETEKRLRESQKHLRTIFESSLVGITVCDMNGKISDANDAFLGITGYTREDLKKGRLNWLKMTPADYAAANDRAMRELLENGYAAPFEKEYLRKDGSTVPVMVGGALMGADGGVAKLVCVVLDITRVKMAEEALAKDRNMLRAIMENTEAQLAYLGRDFNFLAVNSAYARGSRQSAKRLIGRNHFALFPDPENQAIFERVRDTGETVRFHDKAFAFADQPERGTTYWDWSLVPVKDSSGKVDGLVLSLVDTTERVRIEDELTKHRERLESLVELRTRKLTRSYDLLRKEIAERKKIEEELRSLSNRLVEMQEEERKSLARELHDEIGQSLTIVKLFLDRCHSQLEDETFRRDSVEVRAIVKKLMEQVRSLSLDLRPTMLDDLGLMSALQYHFNRFTDQSHVQVNFKQSGLEKKRIPPEVGTAAYRIVQEALTNVARYANVAEAMVSIEAKKGLLRIEVEDHGVGFDMEKAVEGPGAGLSGIRERVIALNGTLTIESAEGAGTYVLAELPLPDGADKKAAKTSH